MVAFYKILKKYNQIQWTTKNGLEQSKNEKSSTLTRKICNKIFIIIESIFAIKNMMGILQRVHMWLAKLNTQTIFKLEIVKRGAYLASGNQKIEITC